MTSKTFTSLSELAGSRIADDERMRTACETLDDLPCTDFLSTMTVASQTRSDSVTLHEVIEGNRFHSPSSVPPQDFHWLEGLIFDVASEVEFAELSPLQPFGINHVLAGTNQKNIVSSLRRSEVDADATTALFRIAIKKYLEDRSSQQNVRIGAHVRTVRAQVFDPNTNFLPHFKVFGEVSTGEQDEDYGAQELTALIRHLSTEVDILDKVAASGRSNIQNLRINIGNLVLLDDFAAQGKIDLVEARRNTANPDYSVIRANSLDIPEYLALGDPDLLGKLTDIGFRRGVKITEKIRRILENHRPDILSRVNLHLGRVAGTGYYRHICYKIDATNKEGLTIPIADGGTTDWATKATHNKQLYTVSSGIGTELTCRYLIT